MITLGIRENGLVTSRDLTGDQVRSVPREDTNTCTYKCYSFTKQCRSVNIINTLPNRKTSLANYDLNRNLTPLYGNLTIYRHTPHPL